VSALQLRGGHVTEDPRLDRLPEVDERNADFPIRAALPRRVPLRGRTWVCRPRLNQYNEGACVGFGWSHELAATPVSLHTLTTEPFARSLYREAQRVDEWAGEDYEGTSVLAAAKVLTAWGYLAEYRWALDIDDAVDTLVAYGPLVMGTDWTPSMFDTRPSGLLEVSGLGVGGHCWLARGIILKPRLKGERIAEPVVRCVNSWGNTWGVNGEFYLKVSDWERLIKGLGRWPGDACVPVQRLRGK
jgi:hypothetical protein